MPNAGNEAAATFSAIDLGLSVEWAPCNIGATTQEECGKYYSWGEIEEKADYSWETYKWCNGNTIFLPAAGCRYYDETEARYVSELGCYWSSSSTASDHPTSYAFSFEEDDFMESDNVSRYPGLTIRPVKAK